MIYTSLPQQMYIAYNRQIVYTFNIVEVIGAFKTYIEVSTTWTF